MKIKENNLIKNTNYLSCSAKLNQMQIIFTYIPVKNENISKFSLLDSFLSHIKLKCSAVILHFIDRKLLIKIH